MKVLGQISSIHLKDLYSWVEQQDLTRTTYSNSAPARIEKWYRFASNLQSLSSGRAAIYAADYPGERICALGDRLYPDWHSLLVCGGDTTINWHFDHGHFLGKAVMVNLGEALYSECSKRSGYTPIKWQDYHLTDGMVVEIDTKLLHKAQPLSMTRCNLTFRRFKSQYLKLLPF